MSTQKQVIAAAVEIAEALDNEEILTKGKKEEVLESLKQALEDEDITDLDLSAETLQVLEEEDILPEPEGDGKQDEDDDDPDGEQDEDDDDPPEAETPEAETPEAETPPAYPKKYPEPDAISADEFKLLKKEYQELKDKDDHTKEDVARMAYLKKHGKAVNEHIAAQKTASAEGETPPEEETPVEVTPELIAALAGEMNVVLKFDAGDCLDPEADTETLKAEILECLSEIEETDFVAKKGKTVFTETAAATLKALGCTCVPAPKKGKGKGKAKGKGKGKSGPRASNVEKTAFGHWKDSSRGKLDLALEKGGTIEDIAKSIGCAKAKVSQHLTNLRKQDGTKFPKVNIAIDGDKVKVTLA